ncbi:hypothetical protein CDL15_Pgr006504 [Punica granatum]|uniref:Uncharacterized protein n=1 Tax=Punica granatum TaxID=22663 RepID=A0A218XYU1_PUNGR|nr:hypothetical protein CDL15_Pgr006504 [Punica granatum]
MESLWQSATFQGPNLEEHSRIEFWSNPERTGWLTKQGIALAPWFKDPNVTHFSAPHRVNPVSNCLTIKGSVDVLNKPLRFRGVHKQGHDVLHCRFREGGGLDQLHRRSIVQLNSHREAEGGRRCGKSSRVEIVEERERGGAFFEKIKNYGL